MKPHHLLWAVLLACADMPRPVEVPNTDGTFTHEGSIGEGQRVAYTQVLRAGPVVACVDGRKPGEAEFLGHLEVARIVGDDARPLSRGDSWRAPAGIREWTGWCEAVGDVGAGDLVRLVSEVAAVGVFRFRLHLKEP